MEVRLGLLTDDEDLTLDYVLTNDDDVTRTGTVTPSPKASQDPEEPEATLDGVHRATGWQLPHQLLSRRRRGAGHGAEL